MLRAVLALRAVLRARAAAPTASRPSSFGRALGFRSRLRSGGAVVVAAGAALPAGACQSGLLFNCSAAAVCCLLSVLRRLAVAVAPAVPGAQLPA